MKGINKAIIIGNLGQDPETRYTASGAAICTLSVATSEKWKDKQSGEQKENTEWHRVVMFGKVAEVADQYLSKGSTVYIEGKIKTRKWEDKEGGTRYTTEIVVDGFGGQMQMLGSPGERKPAQAKQAKPTGFRDKPEPGTDFDESEDDIPF